MSHADDLIAPKLSRLDVPPETALDDDVRKLVKSHHNENWIRSLALNPDTARRFTSYFGSLFAASGARLPLRERELIAVVVSAENGCGLCEIHHTQALGDLLEDHARARRIALDTHTAPLSEREHALVEIARKVTHAPRDVVPGDFDRLRRLGFTDQDILEVVETASWFNHTNRIFISLGVVPDEKFFAR